MRHVLFDWYQALLWLVIIAAALVRLNGLMLKAESDWVQTDVGRDILIGRHISNGWDGWWATPHSSWVMLPSSPLHYWLVAGVYGLTGSVYGVYLVYVVISLVAVWVMSLIGREVAGKFAGLFFALLAAVSPVLLGYATLLSQISLLPVLSSVVVLGLLRYVRQTKPVWLWLVASALLPMVLLHNSGILFAMVVIGVCLGVVVLLGRLKLDGWLVLLMAGMITLALYWGVLRINAVTIDQLVTQVWSELGLATLTTRGVGLAQLIEGLGEGIYPSFAVVLLCQSLIFLFWRWQSRVKQRLAYVLLILVWSTSLVGLAPIQSLGGLREHYLGPWLVLLLVASWGWPWFLPHGWFARLAKVATVGLFGWWLFAMHPVSFQLPNLTFSAAPQSLSQLLWADAYQSGFDQVGFEIWSVIWEQDELVITDWYSGGWWDNLEQISGRKLVSIESVRTKQNNIRVNTIGGGVYVICPDDPMVSEKESGELQKQFGVPTSVLGRQWLSRPTAECLDIFWRDGDDADPKPKTWLLGRVSAPGSKTGGYALIKYHN